MPATSTTLPAPAEVGARARQILAAMQAHELYKPLTGGSMRYTDCWATFTGYPTIARWSLETDQEALLVEALRVLALKATVLELSGGDEQAAELLVPSPVDEMVHAVLAQPNVLRRIEADLGVRFPHATEREEFAYEPDGYTDRCYTAAGWGTPNRRYWFGAGETRRRLGVLNARYQAAGFLPDGRGHGIDFDGIDSNTLNLGASPDIRSRTASTAG
jgi:hypothetical protein